MSKKKGHLSITKVQTAFNDAIRRRDNMCRVRDERPCAGGLQCSHFYPVGSNNTLRFYPHNAYGQCAGHHLSHHNRNPAFYFRWITEVYPTQVNYMESVRHKTIKYTQEVLKTIYEYCITDNLDDLEYYLKELLND